MASIQSNAADHSAIGAGLSYSVPYILSYLWKLCNIVPSKGNKKDYANGLVIKGPIYLITLVSGFRILLLKHNKPAFKQSA